MKIQRAESDADMLSCFPVLRQLCRYVELDSGSKWQDAHKFYRANGLEEVALHFSLPLPGVAVWTSEQKDEA